jgi:hypothetical protein
MDCVKLIFITDESGSDEEPDISNGFTVIDSIFVSVIYILFIHFI